MAVVGLTIGVTVELSAPPRLVGQVITHFADTPDQCGGTLDSDRDGAIRLSPNRFARTTNFTIRNDAGT